MDIRTANTSSDITYATCIDEVVTGSRERAEYIASVAEQGGLIIGSKGDVILGFCLVDHFYFFNKPFISLLVVNPQMQRQGIGRNLLSFVWKKGFQELWTSTNQSNTAMRALLSQLNWAEQGKLYGLDKDDPELFFRKAF